MLHPFLSHDLGARHASYGTIAACNDITQIVSTNIYAVIGHLSVYACTCYVLILAAAVSVESRDPEPAPASRKGRKKKEEVAAAQAAEEAAREAANTAAAAAEAASVARWLDSGGNPEEDRRRFPYHRWMWALPLLCSRL
jgi:hypothetical protein